MQQVAIELKLLAGSESRTDPGVTSRYSRLETVLREEIRQIDSRWAQRFEQHQSVADEEWSILRETRASVEEVRAQTGELQNRIAGGQEDLARAWRSIEEVHKELAAQQKAFAERMELLEQTLHAQAMAIERALCDIARSDDGLR